MSMRVLEGFARGGAIHRNWGRVAGSGGVFVGRSLNRTARKRPRLERSQPFDVLSAIDRPVLEPRGLGDDLVAAMDREVVRRAGERRERAALDRDAANTDPVSLVVAHELARFS